MSEKVIKQLNQIQADVFVLNVKFHNYHWNVKGLQFYGIHAMTEEAYNGLFKIFDDVAERAIQLGGEALVCPKTLIETAKVEKVHADSFSAKDVLENMKSDYEYLLKEFRNLSALANEAGDSVSVAMADEKVGEFEKTLWMISQSLQ